MGGLRALAGLAVLFFGLGGCGGRAALDPEDTGVDPGGPSQGGTRTTAQACTDYCTTLSRAPCAFEATEQCAPSCIRELSRQTPACQKNAVSMLECLQTAVQSNQDCDRGEKACATLIDVYQACAQPVPVTEPPSPPVQPPPPVKNDCTRSGSAGGTSCSEAMVCGDGSRYEVHCAQYGDGGSSCTCAGATFTTAESVASVCSNAVSNCPVAQLGAK